MSGKKTIFLINGPNLNLLGTREVEIYGNLTLKDIEKNSISKAKEFNMKLECYQSNNEGDIVNLIHKYSTYDGLIINPGAYTHSSIAIRDAISGVSIPTIEIHLSNIHAREEFRKHSFIAPVAIGQISGFGPVSYDLAVLAMFNYLKAK